MSIILKALKKVQNQRVEPDQSVPEREAVGTQDVDIDVTLPATPSVEADTEEASFRASKEQFSPRPDRSGGMRQGFTFGPKAVLGVILILGMFTTGWFTSRIYVSLNSGGSARATNLPPVAQETAEDAPASQAPAAAAAVKRSQTQEPVSAPEPAPLLSDKETGATAEPAVIAQAALPDQSLQKAPSTPVIEQEVSETVVPQVKSAALNPPVISSPPNQRTSAVETAPPVGTPEPLVKEPQPKRQGRPELKINAIAWRAQEPKAVVNMQSVRVGDVIEGAVVLAIEKKMIRFEYDGEEFEVRF